VAAVSAALDAVVLGCLEKSPERRFPSVGRVLSALESAIGASDEGPLSVRPRRGQGVAVFVDVRLRGQEDLDDELTRELGALLDRAEATLAAAGMTLAQATGMGVLGVRPLPANPEASRAARRAALGLSRALHEALGGERAATLRIHVNVAVHTADLSFRPTDPPEILGGPLVCTAAWAPRGEVAGVAVNEAALADLGVGDRDGLISTDAATQPDGA
jgi:serine/threonine-protein kinase